MTDQPQNAQQNREDAAMTSFALLRTPSWEPEVFRAGYAADWHDEIEEPVPQDGRPWIFRVGGSVVVMGMQKRSMTENAADRAAEHTDDWPQAKIAAHEHVAHIIVAVVPETASVTENARTTVKVMATLANQANVIAIHAASTLKSPSAYRAYALPMQRSEAYFPARNLIFFGLWQETEGGNWYGCTVGLQRFALPELEIDESEETPMDIRLLLEAAVLTELQDGKIFKDGDEFTTNGRTWRVTLSDSIGIPGTRTMRLDPVGE